MDHGEGEEFANKRGKGETFKKGERKSTVSCFRIRAHACNVIDFAQQ